MPDATTERCRGPDASGTWVDGPAAPPVAAAITEWLELAPGWNLSGWLGSAAENKASV